MTNPKPVAVLDSFGLQGRRALITGSSAGIGLALARALGQAGAQLVLNGRGADKLGAAASLLRAEGLSVSTALFDVTDADAVAQGIQALETDGANNARRLLRFWRLA